MNVLAINCGSSSLKFGLFALDGRESRDQIIRRLAGGSIERLGGEGAQIDFAADGAAPTRATTPVADHAEGVRRLADLL